MKISENWLREWVNPPINGQTLASLITMAGLEVDALSPVAGVFSEVYVAKILQCMPHPQADKLSLCTVDAGSGEVLKIVCGASNVRTGLKVALAKIGARLPGGFAIKEARLRGELSQGMLCSLTELGLSDHSEGIMELAEDAPLGEDLRKYLSLDDHVLDIDLTPNRADCLSVLGIAREVAALTGSALKKIPETKIIPKNDTKKSIHLEAKLACPRYCGRILTNINPHATTPLWMQERLRRSSIRSIHPVVDVTNYVMLELGQPLHAFDLTKLNGDITVRFAHPDEPLELLDGQTVKLAEDVLVIADNLHALAIAGVMGGRVSAVSDTSCDIFLESAYFDSASIAGVARRYGLFTDSSQRFERGVDSQLQEIALDYATLLIQEIAGGEAGALSEAIHAEGMPLQTSVLFQPVKVKKLTGITISEDKITEILQNLGMSITKNVAHWEIIIPSHRMDLKLDVDIIEEIIRLYGYNNIQGEKMTATVLAGSCDPSESLAKTLSNFFANRAYHETISYSFVDPEIQEALYPQHVTLKLLNPISSELSQMRVGLWPGLLASMIYNSHRQQTAIKIFEQGGIFDTQDGTLTEHPCVGGLLSGESGALNWSETTRKFDFYDVKGDLQALFDCLNLKQVHFESAPHSALHPGKSAKIIINSKEAGWMGVLHPRISSALNMQDEIIVFELKLAGLLSKSIARYQTVSKFPQIRRDLSFLVDDYVSISQIEQVLRTTVNAAWLKSLDVFDVYKGNSIPKEKKSLAIALTLQDDNRTLVDEEINSLIGAIIKKLEDTFAITLRD